MAILIDGKTRVFFQGITGRQGRIHARHMLDYNVNVTAGISGGKGGTEIEGIPVFDTVADALDSASADASLILVPPPVVKDCAIEAIENGIENVVVITEHVPIHDTMYIRALARERGVRLVGPNTIGVISPGKCKVGIMPGFLYKEGPVGIVSRSGTLTHETASNLSLAGIGQSTCVGIGGDVVPGSSFAEILELFRIDRETKVVVLIGEIGGRGEEEAAEMLEATKFGKPVVAYLAGRSAPSGKKMGHAGAIVSGSGGSYEGKAASLEKRGVQVAGTFEELISSVRNHLERSGSTE
jgi:succinyl-CoA synthetase alpha subunit